MKKEIIALLLVFLIIESSFAYADLMNPIESVEKGLEKTKEALSEYEDTDIIVNVDSYYPEVLNEQDFESDQPGGYPIYVTLTGIKTNPLMDIEKIYDMNIQATGGSTNYIRGIYYKEPRRGYFDLNNLGYMVIRLQNKKEEEVPERLDLNMTATIYYEIQNGFGINEREMVLPILSEEEFLNRKSEFSFWGGRGYIRLNNIRGDSANLVVYDGRLNKNSFSIKEGTDSGKKYLSGGTPYLLFEKEEEFIGRNLRNYYRVRVNQIVGNKDRAKIEMLFNGEYKLKELVEGQYLYTGSKWKVRDIKIIDEGHHRIELINEDTKDRLFLEGGRLYIPSEEEEKIVSEYKFFIDVKYGDLIIKYSGIYNVDPALVAAVINKESEFDKNALSTCGAAGLMQLMPDMARRYGLNVPDYKKIEVNGCAVAYECKKGNGNTCNYNEDERFISNKNIEAGVHYLAELLKRYQNEVDKEKLALAAYNWGEGNADKCKGKLFENCNVPTQTKSYVDAITKEGGLKDEYKNKLKTKSEELAQQISKDRKLKEIDSELNKNYISIKTELNNLIDNGKNNFNAIESVLNKYKTFLVSKNFKGNNDLFYKYRGLVIEDIERLSMKYNEDKVIREGITYYVAHDLKEIIDKYSVEEIPELEEITFVEGTSEYYFEKAIEKYQEVVRDYPSSVYPLKDGKNIVIDAQLKIAEIYDYNLNQNLKAIEEYRKLISIGYSEKEVIEDRIKFLKAIRLKYNANRINIFENGNSIQLTLYGTEKARANDKVKINVNGASDYYSIGGDWTNKLENTGWYLKEIKIDKVIIAKLDEQGKEIKHELEVGKQETVEGGNIFNLEDIELSQEVHVSILPGEEKLTTKSTFKVHIPVEPRLWKLSTEQMNEHINFTEKAINTLDKGIKIVENVYKWWSLGCYSTFAILWVKNVIWFGAKARSLARKDVMSAWKEECSTKGSIETYGNVFNCVTDKKNKDSINNDLKTAQEIYSNSDYKNNEDRILALANKNFVGIGLNEKYDKEAFDVILNEKISDKLSKLSHPKTLETATEKELNKAIIEAREEIKDDNNLKNTFGLGNSVDNEINNIKITLGPDLSPPLIEDLGFEKINKNYIFDFDEGNEKRYYFIGGVPYLIHTDTTNTDNKYKNKTYYIDSNGQRHYFDEVNEIIENKPTEQKSISLISSGKWIGKVDKISLNSVNYLRVSRRGGDGLPLEVELYARRSEFGRTDLSLNTEKADRIAGPFLLEDCIRRSSSDRKEVDIFQSLILDHKNLQNVCSDLKNIDSRANLKEHKAGERVGDYIVEYAIQETGGLQCFDIMDIGDCLTLFSVCDPVMCPASRFTAGGWKVDNVVSTGIFGSVFLGMDLWNFKRIPPEVGICIPGVDAGLKNYKSLLEGYQECLIARRDKGQNVGICDTIRNIGVCKILWREGTSFFRLSGNALDKLLGVVTKADGGGEYVFFQSNIKKTGEFLNFFTNEYATTYFNAYRGASTDEIGEELCKAAIYGKIPGRGNLLDQLVKPEGPVQFIGWFSEVPHSDIGGDLQSDYEIYYHIYAGEDRETVKYYVYLNDVDGLLNPKKLYVAPAGVSKGTKYINRGDFVDETVRLVDNTGYDELCIVVDNQENCGFGRVSSDLLVGYLQDQALEGSVQRDIKNEKQCTGDDIASDPRLIGVVGGIVDSMYPGITKSGLIRVCSKENPGKGVNENMWQDVGGCGENELGQDLGRCWLNKQSYKDALSEYDLGTRNNAAKLFNELAKGLEDDEKIIEGLNTWLAERNSLVGVKKDIMIKSFLGIVSNLETLNSQTITPDLNAKIYFEIGNTYYELALYLNKEEIEEKPTQVQGSSESIGEKEAKDIPLKYKIEFVDKSLFGVFPNLLYEWGGLSWKGKFLSDCERQEGIGKYIKVDINSVSVKDKDVFCDLKIKAINSYDVGFDEVKLVIYYYKKEGADKFEELKLYCDDHKKEDYKIDLGNLNSEEIIKWIKENASKCGKSKVSRISVGDIGYNENGEYFGEMGNGFYILFDHGSPEVKSEDLVIDNFNEALNKFLDVRNVKVSIIGYASEDGDESYNLQLSEDRAKSVYNILNNKGLIGGFTQPSASFEGRGETTEFGDDYGLNRRVEVEFISDGSEEEEGSKGITNDVLILNEGVSNDVVMDSEEIIMFNMGPGDTTNHLIEIKEIKGDKVTLTIFSERIDIILNVKEIKEIDIDGDGVKDIIITLDKIENGKAYLKIRKLLKQLEEHKLSVEINSEGGDKVTGTVYALGGVVNALPNLIVEIEPNFRKITVSSDDYIIDKIETINVCIKSTCSLVNKQNINPIPEEKYDFEIGIPEEEGFYEPFHTWDKLRLKIPSTTEQSYIITPVTLEETLINNQAEVPQEVSSLIVKDENSKPVVNQQVLVIEGNKILDYRTNNKGMVDLTKPEGNPCNIYNDEKAVFGKQYGCYLESECRAEYIKDSSDCSEGKICCRPKCESVHGRYECVDTNVYECKSEIKRYYCPGDSSVVCCEKGSEKQGASEYSIVVSLSDVKLDLYKGNNLIKSYPIIVGKDCDPNKQRQCELSEGICNERKTKSECIEKGEDKLCYWDDTECVFVPSCTPVGEYEICEKVENKPAPRWGHSKGFNEDKGNPFGVRWHRLCEREEDLIFTPFGVHGTSSLGDQIFKMRESSIGKGFLNIASNIFTDLDPEYASSGCIRMSNENILDLYKYTKIGNENSLGTRVTIIYNT